MLHSNSQVLLSLFLKLQNWSDFQEHVWNFGMYLQIKHSFNPTTAITSFFQNIVEQYPMCLLANLDNVIKIIVINDLIWRWILDINLIYWKNPFIKNEKTWSNLL